MPNFNARIRTDVGKTGMTNIKIRMTHKGESRFFPTKYYIEPQFFDNAKGRVKSIHPLADELNVELTALELIYQRKLIKLEGRVNDISINELIIFLEDSNSQGALDFLSIAERRAEYLSSLGKDSSAAILKQTIKHVKAFHGTDIIPFSAINPAWLRGFEATYKMNGSQNSAAIHMRNIRSIFNIAIEDYGLSQEVYPFRKFKIKTVQTIHRDLNLQEIAHLLNYQTNSPKKRVAVDLWLLSFFLLGINFKDMLLAPKKAIKKGRLEYNRAKTQTVYSIFIEPEAQKIIDRYKGDKLMLRFMEEKAETRLKSKRTSPAYKDITDLTNEYLKEVAIDINTDKDGKVIEQIDSKISTYYARHSWASLASKLEVSHDIIKEALGHSRSVTDMYINFYLPRIDVANRKIIDAVNSLMKEERAETK